MATETDAERRRRLGFSVGGDWWPTEGPQKGGAYYKGRRLDSEEGQEALKSHEAQVPESEEEDGEKPETDAERRIRLGLAPGWPKTPPDKQGGLWWGGRRIDRGG